MKKTGYISMKKSVIELNFFFHFIEKKIPTFYKRIQITTFFRIGAINKLVTGITQKIWQPTFESFLAVRCKGPDKINFFFESLAPKELTI